VEKRAGPFLLLNLASESKLTPFNHSLYQDMLPQELLDFLLGKSTHRVTLNAGHVASCYQRVKNGLFRGLPHCTRMGMTWQINPRPDTLRSLWANGVLELSGGDT